VFGVERIQIGHIRPAKPTRNAHGQSFHGRLREECLRVKWFISLFEARRKVAASKGGTLLSAHEAAAIQKTERICGRAEQEKL